MARSGSVRSGTAKEPIEGYRDSRVAQALFGNVRWSWIWLVLRLYIGYEWFMAGIAKVTDPAWVGGSAGEPVRGFVNFALTKTGGEHPDVQGWYAWFLENAVSANATFWSNFVAIGELAVGAALILGLFTGVAAFFGGVMNANYLLAGTVSSNPVLLIGAFFLVLAWKTAGWFGLDRWVLPALGTPWSPGKIFRREREVVEPVEERV